MIILSPASNSRTVRTALAALVILILLLGACTPSRAPQTTAPVTVKIAVLPIIDALPFYVAEKQGYFSNGNIAVTFIPAASAAERDQLIASGQADGMINDLIAVGLYNKQSVQLQTVAFACVANAKTPMFRVLASKDSGIETAANLAGVPIGMSQNTIIDYVTSRLLEREGLNPGQIQSLAVPKLPDRLALLSKGELKAATLPEPFGSMAQQSGARLIVDDSKYPEYGSSVISFRKAFIDQNPQAIRGFLSAVDRASADINKSPEAFRPLLAEYKMVPEAIQAAYKLPVFPRASVPSEAQWKDVVEWMKARKLIEKDLSYGESITAKFLPK